MAGIKLSRVFGCDIAVTLAQDNDNRVKATYAADGEHTATLTFSNRPDAKRSTRITVELVADAFEQAQELAARE